MINARDKWLAEKLGKFGASELSKLLTGGRRDMTAEEQAAEKAAGGKRKTVDILFGDTAMTLINEKIAEILTGQSKEDISGLKATDWGEIHEYDAIEFYTDKTGENVTYHGSGDPKFYPYNAFSGASPDAVGSEFNVECKCPFVSSNHVGYLIAARSEKTACAWLKENHLDYYVQCQFAMMACKVKRSVFISFDPRMILKENKLAIIKVEPDEIMQADIKYRLEEAGKIIRAVLAQLGPKTSTIIVSDGEGCMIVERG